MYLGEMTSALGLGVLSWVYLAQPSLSKLAAHLQSCNKLERFVSPKQTVLGKPEMEEGEMSSYSYSPGSPVLQLWHCLGSWILPVAAAWALLLTGGWVRAWPLLPS